MSYRVSVLSWSPCSNLLSVGFLLQKESGDILLIRKLSVIRSIWNPDHERVVIPRITSSKNNLLACLESMLVCHVVLLLLGFQEGVVNYGAIRGLVFNHDNTMLIDVNSKMDIADSSSWLVSAHGEVAFVGISTKLKANKGVFQVCRNSQGNATGSQTF